MQIGRVSGLAEPTGLSQPNVSDVEFGVLATPLQARQLLGHFSNGAERFVPMSFASLPQLDGLYQLTGVTVEADTNLEAAGLRQVQVSASAQNRGRQIANSVLLVRGDSRERTGNVGLTGPLFRAAIPDGATSVTSFNAGPGGFVVEGSAVPTLRGDVVRLVDDTQVLASVARATTANITLSGTVSVDGANAANGSRVLVKNQTTAANNGVYVVNTGGAWTRATDADGGTELDRALVFVTSGTANAGSYWMQPASGITIGTTAQVWQRRPLWGLRESDRGGPVSISYVSPLANWYRGACTITQGGEVLTGDRVGASGDVLLDNGLIRVGGNQGFLTFEIASGSPLAFNGVSSTATVYLLLLRAETAGDYVLGEPSVITNTPDVCSVRFRFDGGSVDLSVMRGCRTATVSISTSFTDRVLPYLNFFTSPVFGSPEAGSGIGFTSPSNNMLYATSDDDFGNRVGLSYAGVLSGTAPNSQTPLGRAHAFGLHAIVGGGTTKTGDDQLYGLSREWFAMLSQQTSCGVL